MWVNEELFQQASLRIESEAAQPGEIVISADTYDPIRSRFKFRRLEPKVLRGRTTPSEFYAVED